MIQVQIDEGLEVHDGINHALMELLEKAARLTILQLADQPQSDATLVLSDDAQLQTLNRTYLGIDAPTDVLAFPGGEADPETGVIYLGDVVISYPRAVAQAADGGHPVELNCSFWLCMGCCTLVASTTPTLKRRKRCGGFRLKSWNCWIVRFEVLRLRLVLLTA